MICVIAKIAQHVKQVFNMYYVFIYSFRIHNRSTRFGRMYVFLVLFFVNTGILLVHSLSYFAERNSINACLCLDLNSHGNFFLKTNALPVSDVMTAALCYLVRLVLRDRRTHQMT